METQLKLLQEFSRHLICKLILEYHLEVNIICIVPPIQIGIELLLPSSQLKKQQLPNRKYLKQLEATESKHHSQTGMMWKNFKGEAEKVENG